MNRGSIGVWICLWSVLGWEVCLGAKLMDCSQLLSMASKQNNCLCKTTGTTPWGSWIHLADSNRRVNPGLALCQTVVFCLSWLRCLPSLRSLRCLDCVLWLQQGFLWWLLARLWVYEEPSCKCDETMPRLVVKHECWLESCSPTCWHFVKTLQSILLHMNNCMGKV